MRKAYPLRLNKRVMDALRAWAADDLRSVNAQIEFLLVRALRESGRLADGRSRRSSAGNAGTGDEMGEDEDGRTS